MKAAKFIIPAIVLIADVIFQSLFIVQEISQAIVLQFGDPKKIVTKAGLNFKLPFIQNVVFLDKRILNLDNEPEEVIAADQKRLIVDAIARFKIVDPLKFYISVGNERVARSRLSTIINLTAFISLYSLIFLILVMVSKVQHQNQTLYL